MIQRCLSRNGSLPPRRYEHPQPFVSDRPVAHAVATALALGHVVQGAHRNTRTGCFWNFLATSDGPTLNDREALSAALDGAEPGLVNMVLPPVMSTSMIDGLPPLMWAVCHEHWPLVEHLLDHGADPHAEVAQNVIGQRLSQDRGWVVPDHAEKIKPFTLAVLLLDRIWETKHKRDVHMAWRFGTNMTIPSPVDQDPAVASMLEAFLRHGATWNPDPNAGRMAHKDACLSRLVYGVSSLQAWSDEALLRMDVHQCNDRQKSLLHEAITAAYSGTRHSAPEEGFGDIPALSRLCRLGVNPNQHNCFGKTPAHELITGVVAGDFSEEILKKWLHTPQWDWSVQNKKGLTPLECMEVAIVGMADDERRHRAQAKFNSVLCERIEREARTLRKAIKKIDQQHPRETDDDATPAARSPRRRL